MVNNKELPKILHLDDDEDFLEMFFLMFKKMFHITSLNNPKNAVNVLKEKLFDLIITDYEMPLMNGLDFLRKVKEEFPDTPVIFYTGQGNEEIAREAFILGASDYFTKEIRGFAHTDKLLNSINRAVENKRILDEKKKNEIALKESEERFRTIAETVPSAIYRSKPGAVRNMEYISSFIFFISGYPDSDFIDSNVRSFDSIVFPEDKEIFKTAVQEAVSQHAPWAVDYRITHRDGSIRWVHEEGKAFYDKEGKTKRLDGVIIDYTERKKASGEVKYLRNLLGNIVNSMPSIIIAVNNDCRIIQWNRQAEKITGVPSKEALGKGLVDVYPDIMHKPKKIKQAIEKGKIYEELRVPITFGGDTRYRNITVYPLQSNGIKGAVIRIDDVTERVKIEEMMVQSERMISMGELASGVAHSINDPLAGIIQNAFVLKNRLLEDMEVNRQKAIESGTDLESVQNYINARKIDRLLKNILDSGNQAMNVVHNILSFTGKPESKRPLQSITLLLDRAIELARQDYDLKAKYDFRKIKIIRKYEPDLPHVSCDVGKIQLAFLNILKNRAYSLTEHSRSNGFIPQFTVVVKKIPGMISIEIEDNGPPIDENLKKAIFTPFHKLLDKADKENAGLALSFFIINEIHKGTIEIESQGFQGARFIIKIPAKEERTNEN